MLKYTLKHDECFNILLWKCISFQISYWNWTLNVLPGLENNNNELLNISIPSMDKIFFAATKLKHLFDTRVPFRNTSVSACLYARQLHVGQT